MTQALVAIAAVLTALTGTVGAIATSRTKTARKLRHAMRWADETAAAIRKHNRLIHPNDEGTLDIDYPEWLD